MATFIDINKVTYGVENGNKYPLCKLYFCRYCLTLRSNDCVWYEVECHYCPNCLEHMQAGEAQYKKNRCNNCFDCPICQHKLTPRATTSTIINPEGDGAKATPKKVYYLACGFCRWTSRDVGMPDQAIASGGWLDRENSKNQQQIANLMDYYRQVAFIEKSSKDKKKSIKRRSVLTNDKYGLSSLAAKKRASVGLAGLSLADEERKLPEVTGSVATDQVPALPESIFTQPLKLTEVTTIGQRLADPEYQPESVTDLYPLHRHLLVKHSQRCRYCEHNVIKPEYNPATIKFKIQLSAVNHVPEIRIRSVPSLRQKQTSAVVLTAVNPLDIMTQLQLTAVYKPSWSTAKLEVPACTLVIPARDDTMEFDDPSELDSSKEFADDPSVVVFRKANHVGFLVKVTPDADKGNVQACLEMTYIYKNISLMTNQGVTKEPEIVNLKFPVFLDFGQVSLY